ncbi:MAG: hypothetical protein A3I05_08840 [Deltaproteobacteria bacterium RIFCSPLOWO2_02_FULL_44_10]|nr:MAG: hypothetical protein A3C46_08770 [Deltaproteobacteria bacterium RIFCSPHIGHO2_02_FULL_44_16]OGQ45270.1 MAG: hypothetical protein A3I05_08840 [Deltaproteobacteria bacterium RIFCSPLOWO2_02_FULL_44_10]
MVMIAGPRQCGKTTLAKALAKKTGWTSHYYNWDVDEHRKQILEGSLDAASRLWILDEIHKYRRWKNWLKGNFDQHHPQHAFLVTGSAKLHAYSHGGDSLQGRYYAHHLHPFTLSELLHKKVPASLNDLLACDVKDKAEMQNALQNLMIFGGFPEPLFSASEQEASRWRLSYGVRLVRDEIRTLERLQELDRIELLLDRLPITVGSVLSINSLREDLEVAFETVKNWLTILEKLYAVFRIAPFGAPRIKAVKKEQKLYFWDWARVEDESARFENLVALHLLRFVHWRTDVAGEKWELRYFRDVVGHEVDFILLKSGKPWCAIEVKLQEQSLDSNVKYLLERVRIPHAFQLHFKGTKNWTPSSINGCVIRILPARLFLSQL